MSSHNYPLSDETVITTTQAWLEKAVIGLNLCPFAKAVYVKNQIRFTVSHAETTEDLLTELIKELNQLQTASPAELDTTLLIHPQVLNNFLDYNDFLSEADAAIEQCNLLGIIQIASFHPAYQFAGSAPDDIENCTNRSPYPILHLLREDSIDRAVAAFPKAEQIFEANIKTLRRLGRNGWNKLMSTSTD